MSNVAQWTPPWPTHLLVLSTPPPTAARDVVWYPTDPVSPAPVQSLSLCWDPTMILAVSIYPA